MYLALHEVLDMLEDHSLLLREKADRDVVHCLQLLIAIAQLSGPSGSNYLHASCSNLTHTGQLRARQLWKKNVHVRRERQSAFYVGDLFGPLNNTWTLNSRYV